MGLTANLAEFGGTIRRRCRRRRPVPTPAGLAWQVVALCLAAGLLLGVALHTTVTAFDDRGRQTRAARTAHQAVVTAVLVHRAVLEMEHGEHRYVVTGDPAHLRSWARARAVVESHIARLPSLTADRPAQATLAAGLDQQIRQYLDTHPASAIRALRPGPAAAPDLGRLAGDQHQLDAIRRAVEQFVGNERRVAAAQEASAERAFTRAGTATALGIITCMFVIPVLIAYTNRTIVRPVRTVAAMADSLTGGARTGRTPTDGPYEIGVLQRSFNAMALSSQRHRDDLNRIVLEQKALQRIARLMACTEAPDAAFDVITAQAGRLFGADAALLVRYDGDGAGTILTAWAGDHPPEPTGKHPLAGERTPLPLPLQGTTGRMQALRQSFCRHVGWERRGLPGAADSGTGGTCGVGAPIMVRDQVWGALALLGGAGGRLRRDDAEHTADFIDLAGLVVDTVEARTGLAAASARLVGAGDETRRRLERDLHDRIQHHLIAIILRLRMLKADLAARDATATGPVIADQIATIDSDLANVIDEVRTIADGVYPAILTQRGLEAALDAMARRSPIPIDRHIRLSPTLPPVVQTSVYDIVAESLANTAKHARATHLRIVAHQDDRQVCLRIEDDGTGGADTGRGTGIRGITDRVQALGGTVELHSPRGEGTRLLITIPLRRAEPPA
ncbi:CHASE3 domain-containing protein [Dactylosporangium roseum]|uniref:histidine kinase n=1 Tax=Dactylosporangium roseum TaxID=47989 RepID=A0ABY5YVK4_9ACTN|nr:CHASE3 domain-containing protein [Dactylosporangium roseum]UWZ33424.1 CHASE3 domain-containing protein [Dactylosporangium roseum]